MNFKIVFTALLMPEICIKVTIEGLNATGSAGEHCQLSDNVAHFWRVELTFMMESTTFTFVMQPSFDSAIFFNLL